MPACNLLKNHMFSSVGNHWKPCCRFDEQEQTFLVQDMSFDQYKKTNFYQNLVDTMEKGNWHPGCYSCERDEILYNESYRTYANKYFSGKKDVIEFIEFSPSNKCNLICKMCSPANSTRWHNFIIKNKDLNLNKFGITPRKNNFIPFIDTLNSIDVSKLKKIKILGGDPFVMPEVEKIFKYLIEKNIINDIQVELATNCTITSRKLLKYLYQFKSVELDLSIDGVGKVNEYIRYGHSWKTIEKNLKKWSFLSTVIPDFKIRIFSTIQAYNIHDIKNIKNLSKKYNISSTCNILNGPKFLNINVLPEEYINRIKDEYNSHILSIYKNDRKSWPDFVEYTNKLDSRTGITLKDVNPLLYSYFKNGL